MSMKRFQLRFSSRTCVRGTFVTCLAMIVTCCMSIGSRGDVASKSTDKFFTNEFFEAYCAAGLLLPLTEKGPNGRRRVFRTLEASGISFLLTEGLKSLTREERPDHTGHDSFPSSHASLSFAIATMESAYHPKSAPYWYAGATLISLARVDEGKHFGQDALVGAALGYGVARWELSRKHGLILQPLISSRATGFIASAKF
jgi:hypothetical protein